MVNKYFRKSVCSVLTAVTVMLGSANTAGLYLVSAEEAVTEAEATTEQEKEEKQEDSEQEKELKAETEEVKEEAPPQEVIIEEEKQEEPASEPVIEEAKEEEPAEVPEDVQTEDQVIISEEPIQAEADGDGQGQDGQSQNGQGQDGQGQDSQGQDGQGQNGQGQDGQEQDGQGQDGQGQDGQGQDGQGQDGQGQDGQGQDGQGQDGQGQDNQDQKEAYYTEAALRYSGSKFNIGDTIGASISGAKSNDASKIIISYDIPEAASFKAMASTPKFEGADCSVEYKSAEGTYSAYNEGVDAASVKGFRITATKQESAEEIEQTREFAFSLMAEKPATASSSARTDFEGGKSAASKDSSAGFVIDLKNSAEISMTQDPAAVSRADEATQNVSVSYKNSVSSVIRYELNESLTALKLSVGAESAIYGAKGVIESDAGSSEIEMTGDIDLESYANVKSITITPNEVVESGKVAAFSVTFKAKKDDESALCSVSVENTIGENKETISKSLTTQINRADVVKPEISSNGEKVGFGREFAVEFGGAGMTSYNIPGNYEYSILTPDFAEIKEITLPNITGAAKISVYAVEKEEESLIAEAQPAAKLEIGKSGISAIKVVIEPEAGSVTADGKGSVVMTNNSESNKNNYFGFRSEGRLAYKDIEYVKVSDIVGVTFELHEEANVPTPQTQSNEPEHVINSPTTPVSPSSSTDNENSSENPEDSDDTEAENIKAAEEEKKQQIRDDALQREQALKERKDAILSARIGSIRSNVASGVQAAPATATGTATAPKAAEKYAEWEVKPINETIIKDVVKKSLNPISEQIILNVIPEGGIEDSIPETDPYSIPNPRSITQHPRELGLRCGHDPASRSAT